MSSGGVEKERKARGAPKNRRDARPLDSKKGANGGR